MHIYYIDPLPYTPRLCGRSLTGPVRSETFTEPPVVELSTGEGKVGEDALKLRKLPRTRDSYSLRRYTAVLFVPTMRSIRPTER